MTLVSRPRSRFRNWLGRVADPSIGYCRCCGESWNTATEHTTWYAPGRGAFALCETCWLVTTPGERVIFYFAVHGERTNWPAILNAVLVESVAA